MPSVSVVIPTQNRARFLQQAVASVLNQTFGDLEIIIVLKGADAETIAITDRLSANPKIRSVAMAESTVAAARNLGIKSALGEWIAFLDDDDIWLPRKVELQLAAAKEKRADFVICGYVWFNDSGDIDISGPPPRPTGLTFAEALMLGNYVSGGSGPIVKAEAISSIGGFDEQIIYCEDWDLWRRLSWHHQIHYVDQVLFKYRRHTTNLSGDYDYMLPGLALHFGKLLRDTPPELRHMLPAAKSRFFDMVMHNLLAQGVPLNFVGWDALDAKRQEQAAGFRTLENRCAALEAERDAILTSNSWRVSAPLRTLSRLLRHFPFWG